MVSMSHSLLLRDLSILPTPVRWRSEYVHIVAQSREYVHTTYRVEVCPTRYGLPRPSCHALRVIFLGASHHALASPRAFCYAFRTRSYRVLSHNRDLLHLIRGPMLGLLSVPHPERRSIRAKASAAGGVSLRRCAAPTLRSQTDGFGSLACLYRDKRLPRPCQNFAVFALGNTCKVLRG